MSTVSFSPIATPAGSNSPRVNVSKAGAPFGQLWTFKARGERHGWHAKTLAGAYRLFDTGDAKGDFVDAQMWMAAQ